MHSFVQQKNCVRKENICNKTFFGETISWLYSELVSNTDQAINEAEKISFLQRVSILTRKYKIASHINIDDICWHFYVIFILWIIRLLTFKERPAKPLTLSITKFLQSLFPSSPSPCPLQPPSSPPSGTHSCPSLQHPLLPPPPSSWLPIEILYFRGSQRDVVYLGWPIARARMRGGGSQPMSTAVHMEPK